MTESKPDSQQLAALFVQAGAEGSDPDLEQWTARLEDEDDRSTFRRLVLDAQMVGSLLPRQVGPGVVLGGRYKIAEEIGAGGMGKVFKALDLHLDRPVAVKVLAAMGRSDFDPLELFRKESRLLASLRHPNIVAIHEAATDGDVSYLVMELIDGTSIDEVLDTVRDGVEPDARGRRRVPHDGLALARALGCSDTDTRTNLVDERSWWRTVTRIMVDLAGTLESTHDEGIVHRDLKPSNILLRRDGTPIVLDFGLAGFLEGGDGAVTRGFVGSAAYLAPEQVQRRAVGAEPCTDIYQLGLLLYEMLTLERAFPEDNVPALLPLISKGRFLRPRELDRTIPSELEAICLKAMELDPARRYASAKDLREDLERYVGGQELPLAARGGPMAHLARRGRYFVRRHRSPLLVAAAVLLIVATGFITPRFFGESAGVQLFEAYRYDPETLAPIPGGLGDSVAQDDLIGVLISNDQPVYVYAISVFGNRRPPDWVAPLEPWTLVRSDQEQDSTEDPRELSRGDMDGWGLRIEPREGGTHLICARIEETSTDIPYEGLWIITSPEPQPHLTRWMDALQRDLPPADDGAPAVSYNEAQSLFASAGLDRGRSPDFTAEEQERFLSRQDSEAVFGDDWPFEHSQRFMCFFKVDQPLAGMPSGG